MGRTGWAVTITLSSFTAFFAISQMQGKQIPDPLASLLLAVVGGAGVIGGGIVLVDGVKVVSRLRHKWGLRLPIFRKGRPNPLQWLLDFDRHDQENPARQVRITNRFIRSWDLQAKRPFIVFVFRVFNGSVHSIIFSGAKGYAKYNGEELADNVQDQNRGQSRVERGGEYSIVLTQYIPTELAERIYSEIAHGIVRHFDFDGVTLELKVDMDTSQPVTIRLGGDNRFILESG